MEIKRSGSQPSAKGPADWFTGTVHVTMLFAADGVFGSAALASGVGDSVLLGAAADVEHDRFAGGERPLACVVVR